MKYTYVAMVSLEGLGGAAAGEGSCAECKLEVVAASVCIDIGDFAAEVEPRDYA